MMTLGLLPLIVWTIFSIIYYGTPFPNTYFAKMDGDTFFSGLRQGIVYVADFAQYETLPFILALIATGIVIKSRHLKSILLLLGALLYIAYAVKIGGDYMRGRFFTAPYFLLLLSASLATCHQKLCQTDRGKRVFMLGAVMTARFG